MSTAISAAAFGFLADLLRSRSGLVIGQDKIYLLETRLAPILKREKLRDLNDLVDRLRGRGADAVARDVVEAMTTNESFFFRDDKPFQHFRAQALARVVAARGPGVPLRIWSAAASSGQEAYSLAMILSESRALLGDRRVEILGTDLARDQLARAREGVYTQFEVQRGLPVQMLMKYFKKDESNWRISDQIRGMAQFREFNLLSDLRSLGKFDIVFCRNVLIYSISRPRLGSWKRSPQSCRRTGCCISAAPRRCWGLPDALRRCQTSAGFMAWWPARRRQAHGWRPSGNAPTARFGQTVFRKSVSLVIAVCLSVWSSAPSSAASRSIAAS